MHKASYKNAALQAAFFYACFLVSFMANKNMANKKTSLLFTFKLAMFPPIVVKNSSVCFILSFADVIKTSFTSMDACVEPHGRVYASCLFAQQHLKPT